MKYATWGRVYRNSITGTIFMKIAWYPLRQVFEVVVIGRGRVGHVFLLTEQTLKDPMWEEWA